MQSVDINTIMLSLLVVGLSTFMMPIYWASSCFFHTCIPRLRYAIPCSVVASMLIVRPFAAEQGNVLDPWLQLLSATLNSVFIGLIANWIRRRRRRNKADEDEKSLPATQSRYNSENC